MELAANFKEFLDNVSNNDRLGRELNKAAKAGDLRYAGKEKLITVILPDDVSKSWIRICWAGRRELGLHLIQL